VYNDISSDVAKPRGEKKTPPLPPLHAPQAFAPLYLLQSWNSVDGRSFVSSHGDAQVTALYAHDNTNFLKLELARSETKSLKEAWEELLACEEAANTVSGGSSNHQQRIYFRTPLSQAFERDVDITQAACFATGGEEGASERPGAGEEKSEVFKRENCSVWVSTTGCVTPLHFDLCHGFLCQVRGRKRCYLAPQESTRSLYRYNVGESPNVNSSKVNLKLWLEGDQQQRSLYPKVANVELYCIDIGPGEALYIPPFWWHHIETVQGPSISVLLPFDPYPSESIPLVVEA